MWIQRANPNQSQDYSNLTFIYPSAFRSAFSLFSLCVCFDRGPVLLLWQNPTQSPDLAQSTHQTLPFCRAPGALFPQNRISHGLGHTMVEAAAGACLGAGFLWMWAQLEAHSLLGAHPLCAIRPHTPPTAPQIPHGSAGLERGTEALGHCTSHCEPVIPSIHPCLVPKELFWKGSSSQQLNSIHVRHEMPQAALRDWQEMQCFPS